MIILRELSDTVYIARTFSASVTPNVTSLVMVLQHNFTNRVYVMPVPDTVIHDVRYDVSLTMSEDADHGEYNYYLACPTGNGVFEVAPNANPPVTGEIEILEMGILQYPQTAERIENDNDQVYGLYQK